jgi:hypothetical protein
MAQLSMRSAEHGTTPQAITGEVIARFADTVDARPYLKTDAVVGVRPSLICHFEPHGPEVPGVPGGWHGRWCTFERGVGLAHDEAWRS